MTGRLCALSLVIGTTLATTFLNPSALQSDANVGGTSARLTLDANGSVSLEGKPVQLAEIPVGSWCPTGEIDLVDAAPVTVGSLTIERKGDEVALSGKFKASKSKRKRGGYRASTLADDAVETTETIKSKDLKKGRDVEFFDDDGKGLGMVLAWSPKVVPVGSRVFRSL